MFSELTVCVWFDSQFTHLYGVYSVTSSIYILFIIKFNFVLFRTKSLYPLCNSVYVKSKLKIKLNQTIQRYNGPNIGFTLENSMELTCLNIFNVNIVSKY